ncbi:MAG TPA: malto-oligosyltrehalose trehalohydrolase [Azospirillaceae bacterium]|nr:malto-oligosyltrehalose trehalohydrolase [Azospirillaceae bacterium]
MTAHFAHAMPFGAQLREDGHVRFRLWAPSEQSLFLVLEENNERLPMQPAGGGFFELVTDRAHAGSRYRFELADGLRVPDPASRWQPDDVSGPSVVVDPHAYTWRTADWRGRPWHETVLYELHVGTFSEEGTFDGVRRRLDHLVSIGVTAVELMPLSDFAGRRGWGYDGVLPYAPDSAYGTPDDLKALVDEAHARGLMVFLDVVYNHFGPEGNYLGRYAAPFFTDRHKTPWGAAINYDGAGARPVRDFAIHNALYWLEEFRFDGLRLDAVHAIADDSDEHILHELARTVRSRITDRAVHLVLENDDNRSSLLARDDGRPRFYDAQWDDDWHHAAHVLATGEADGYYRDYAEAPLRRFARCLAEGFAYQGEPSPHRDHARRGEPSGDLPPTAFVSFLQNHDQIGNRAMGERLTRLADPRTLRAMMTVLLLAPQPPMLFMGEEWGCRQPFPFFCDFQGDLADAVREGRRREFEHFPAFRDPAARARIPDPLAKDTFHMAKLDWTALSGSEAAGWLAHVRELLRIRMREVVPLLAGSGTARATVRTPGAARIDVDWRFGPGGLMLVANLGPEAAPAETPAGRLIAASDPEAADMLARGNLAGWSALWYRVETT